MSAPSFRSIRHFVHEAAALEPLAPAVHTDNESLPYEALATRIDQVAAELRDAGADASTQIALSLPSNLEFIVWYYGVLQLGASVFPIPEQFTDSELDAALDQAGAAFVIGPTDWGYAQSQGWRLGDRVQLDRLDRS